MKLYEESSKLTQIKRAKGLVKREQIHFEKSIKNFYNPEDCIVLKALNFTVQNKEFHVTFGEENNTMKNKNYNQ